MTPIKVLVVDDSATMRALLVARLSSEADIEVVGTASSAADARQAIKRLEPDVVTLDIEMPEMSGLELLEKIMLLRPMPVIMVSSLTKVGADATIRAFELGAVDCIAKPTPQEPHTFDEIAEKVRNAAIARPSRSRSRPRAQAPVTAGYSPGHALVAIGASTGGVEALTTVLATFPKNCPPTLIVQHMPAAFTKSFAERLNRSCAPEVREAASGEPLLPGRVYLAPGGDFHLEAVGNHRGGRIQLVSKPLVSGHRPSVDAMFGSIARVFGGRAVGAILTGMGRDGASGLLDIRRAGGKTLGQDASSCVVYGMPKVAYDIGAVQNQLPLEAIGPTILKLTNHTLVRSN